MLYSDVFVIPHNKGEYIVYLPVHGILFKGNGAAVNLFHHALSGDRDACYKIGLTKEQVSQIIQGGKEIFTKPTSKSVFKPTSVSLFLTTGCSMKCTYCYANAGEKNKQIKKSYVDTAISEIIKNALELSKDTITVNYHGGGDIGTAWDLVEQTTKNIFKLAKENKLQARINAGLNGVLSNYQRKWVVQNIHSATVSLDGDKEIQNTLRPLKNGWPSFDIVHDTLKYFDSKGFNYSIRSTATAETLRHLERIVTFFCSNYGVRKIKIEPVFHQGRATENNVNMPEAMEFVKYFLKAQKTARSYGRELLYSGARFDVLTNVFCQAAGNSFGVTPDGYLTSCWEVLEKSHPLADIFFYGRIKNGEIQILQDKLDALKKLSVENQEKCRKCFAKFHCAGDCPVKSILAEKEQQSGNYRCIINRELTKNQLLESLN